MWGKLYNLCRVLKSIAIAVFAVMNSPDPHMTKLSKVKLKSWFLVGYDVDDDISYD